MLETIIVIFIILWLLGMVSPFTFGRFYSWAIDYRRNSVTGARDSGEMPVGKLADQIETSTNQ